MTDKKRREWWIYFEDGTDQRERDQLVAPWPMTGIDAVHVRECFPGEIVLSREELRAAFHSARHKMLDAHLGDRLADYLEAELFGKAET